MNCAICIQEDTEVGMNVERMITKCNHFFHKKCFYTANRNNYLYICPLCRTPDPALSYTIKEYISTEIPKQYKSIFKRIYKLAYAHISHNDFYSNFVISGSFAVYMYQVLFNKKTPDWIYSDIDIYYKNGIDIQDNNINSKNIMYILTDDFDNECKNEENNYYNTDEKIKSVKKYCAFPINNITKQTNSIEKLENYDMIRIVNLHDLYKIVEDFDLDCCKIALEFIDNGGLRMYIHNSFYIDSYKIDKYKKTNTLDRVKKYKSRGFLVDF